MAKTIVIKDPKEIPVIVREIHDCWFEKDTMKYDPVTSTLVIRYKRQIRDKGEIVGRILFLKRIKLPTVECFLKFHNVKSYTIEDKSDVGIYDFNELKYCPKYKRILITTGVPIRIKIDIERFEVSVEETDNILEEKISLGI